MAANLFDHPYAAVINLNKSNDEHISDTVTNFKDSPRKVLVHENRGASLDILNKIAQSPDFSCLNSKNALRENGFQIGTNSSSSDDMDTDTLASEGNKDNKDLEKNSDKIDLDKPEKNEVENPQKIVSDKPGISGVNTLDAPGLEKGKTDDTNTFSEKTTGDAQEGNVDKNTQNEAIDEQKEDTNEMEISVDEGNEQGEETDDADEGELNDSLENSTDLTSEIKTGVGNGIVVSVMKKRKGRRKKRKKSAWSKPSPYKIRRVNSGSPKRVSIEEPAESMGDKNTGDAIVKKECDVNESSAQTEESIDSKGILTLYFCY